MSRFQTRKDLDVEMLQKKNKASSKCFHTGDRMVEVAALLKRSRSSVFIMASI